MLDIEPISRLLADVDQEAVLPVRRDARWPLSGSDQTMMLVAPDDFVLADLQTTPPHDPSDDNAFDAYLEACVNQVPALLAEIRRYRALLCEEHEDCTASPQLGAACREGSSPADKKKRRVVKMKRARRRVA